MREKLKSADEVLFRQIHPKMFEKGIPASDRFRPQENDDNQLSVDRSSLCTAAQSYELFVSNGYQSAAVFGVTVGEFAENGVTCFSDPLPKTDKLAENPAHAVADYSPYAMTEQKNIAKKLRQKATDRGKLHPIES